MREKRRKKWILHFPLPTPMSREEEEEESEKAEKRRNPPKPP